jgi:hypothetical protein
MGLFRNKNDGIDDGYPDIFRSARERQRRHFRHRWQWVALVIFLFLVAAGGYGLYWYYSLQGDIQTEVPIRAPV